MNSYLRDQVMIKYNKTIIRHSSYNKIYILAYILSIVKLQTFNLVA